MGVIGRPAAVCLLQGKSYQVPFLKIFFLESKKTSFWFLVGRRHWWRDVRGRQQLERKREEQELINWGRRGIGQHKSSRR